VNNTTVLDNADRTDAGNCCIRKDCTAVFRGMLVTLGQAVMVHTTRHLRHLMQHTETDWKCNRMDDTSCMGSLAFFHDNGGWRVTACYRQTILKALVMYCSRLSIRSSMKSVHRGSLSNSRSYNTTVLYECALENDAIIT